MIYSSFAQLYDQLFDGEMYLKWAQFVQERTTGNDGPLLDLAGGSGRLAVLLAQQNYQVTVGDFSDEMLSIADQHRTESQVDFDLVNVDMTNLEELPKYQTITCFADSLCYLDDIDQIASVFSEVYQHLEAGGQFLFDVISPYQTDEVYPGYMYNFEDDDTAFMWSSFANEAVEHGAIHELTFFTWNVAEQGYDRLGETHYERTYPLNDYQAKLQSAGFKEIEISADFGKGEITPKTTRWFFVCKK